jgi:protein-tyrosine-phosphatase
MTSPPRAFGRPLDDAAAHERARQAAALTDPLHLRILSLVATTGTGRLADAELASALELEADRLSEALAQLNDAGLLPTSHGRSRLTADAWVRFGRLVVGSSDHRRSELPPATRPLSLPPVAERIAEDLAYRFSATFSAETVRKYVADSWHLLASRAKVTTFLPSLTTRFASDRLSALATAEGLVLRGTPEVLFVCVQNAGRSQMASAILRHLAGDAVHVRTAGSAPAATIRPEVIAALDEIGVPIAAEFPKPLTDEVVQAADFVVTMGCGDACPVYPGRRYMAWELEDPVGLEPDRVRQIRDDIVARVRALIDEMGLGPRPH